MKSHYLLHILFWMGPILILQWIIGIQILRRNLWAIIMPSIIATIYLTTVDSIAIREKIWFFDQSQCLGWKMGPYVPFEEFLFFMITSILVAQSMILLLPNRLRY